MVFEDANTGKQSVQENSFIKFFKKAKVGFSKLLTFLVGRTTYQVMFRVYFLVILIGALILASPISLQPNSFGVQRNGFTAATSDFNFTDALFVACSGFSTTGLTTVNIYEVLTPFGQITLLVLIQLGGIGTLSLFYCLINAIGKIFIKKDVLNIKQIQLLNAERGTNKINETIKAVSIAIVFFLALEIIFMFIFSLCFCFIPGFSQATDKGSVISYDDPTRSLGLFHHYGKSLWVSCFVTIASACNAGFDNISNCSVAPYRNDWGTVLQFFIVVELIIGAIGHFVVYDFIQKIKAKYKKEEYKISLTSKVCVITYGILVVISIITSLCFEFFTNDQSSIINCENLHKEFGNNVMYNKVCSILFNAFNTRSLGMYVVSPKALTHGSMWVSNICMLIGGSPCSTAGGMRTTTIAIILIAIWCKVVGRKQISIAKKGINNQLVIEAFMTFFICLTLVFFGTLIVGSSMAAQSSYKFTELFFENCSAFGGCGLSLDITAQAKWWGLLYLVLLMFIGQLNIITTLLSWTKKNPKYSTIQYPEEVIKIA